MWMKTIRPSDELLARIRMEYVEMPGLALTPSQARRLWDLDVELCHAILSALVDEQFLTETRTGAFVRAGGLSRSVYQIALADA